MNTKKLFQFIPQKKGDTGILFYHKDGYYKDDYNNFDRFSILHQSKQKESYKVNRYSIFKEIIHWLRVYRMQNKRKAIIPTRIVVYECGSPTELIFNPYVFKIIIGILNALPAKLLKYKKFERIWGI